MRNRYIEAFKEGGNILGLASFAAASAALLNPVPIAVGLALELVYLAFVPDMKWYQQRLSNLFDNDIEKRRAELKARILSTLRPEMQERFAQLESVRNAIDKDSGSDATWFREILRKLDFLLEKFLQFAGKEAQFRAYLYSVLSEVQKDDGDAPPQRMRMVDTSRARAQLENRKRGLAGSLPPDSQSAHKAQNSARLSNMVPQAPEPLTAIPAISAEDRWAQATVLEVQQHYDRELAGIKQLCEVEDDTGTKAVLNKRIEVLSRRREFVGKIGRIMTNLNHQLSLLEDTFGLISDEIRARPPDQVLADIEDVVSQTNTMTQALEEMAPFEQMLERMTA